MLVLPFGMQAGERGGSVASPPKGAGGRDDHGLDHGDGRVEAPWRGTVDMNDIQ